MADQKQNQDQNGKPQTDAATREDGGGVEGEGSYTATHRYNEGLKKSIEAGKSEELAQQAKAAIDGPEGDELRKAEEIGKSHRADTGAKPTRGPDKQSN